MNKSIINFSKALAFCFVVITAISCSDDDDNGTKEGVSCNDGDFGVTLSAPIPGSTEFSYYTFSVDDVMSGTITAEGVGFEQTGYYQFTQIDNTIYSLGGLDNTNVVGFSQNSGGCLEEFGDVSFGDQVSDFVKADDNTLVSASVSRTSDIITFRKFNQNTLAATETIEVQVSDITTEPETGLEYTGMVISGDHLFLSYYKMHPTNFTTNPTDQAEVAVYSYPELEFQEVITDDRVGPIGGFGTKTGLLKDAAGNVYAISHSNPANGFIQNNSTDGVISEPVQPAGVLKINAGETSFDADYFFDTVSVAGGTFSNAQFLNNGKLFVDVNTQALTSQVFWSDSPLESAIVDLETKSVDFIQGFPEHTRGGREVSLIEDGNNIYTTVTEENGIFVYQIDPQNFTATKGAELQTAFESGFFKF